MKGKAMTWKAQTKSLWALLLAVASCLQRTVQVPDARRRVCLHRVRVGQPEDPLLRRQQCLRPADPVLPLPGAAAPRRPQPQPVQPLRKVRAAATAGPALFIQYLWTPSFGVRSLVTVQPSNRTFDKPACFTSHPVNTNWVLGLTERSCDFSTTSSSLKQVCCT